MCINPLKIIAGDREIPAPCRKCEQCIAKRKMHWIGRMLATEQTAKAVWFCTFTYGSAIDENDDIITAAENPAAMWLKYEHLQQTFKKMRKAGHKFQYIAVGEYGSKHSRAHFHAIIYWLSEPPERPLGRRLKVGECSFWDRGFMQYELPRSSTAASVYMMDYLEKDNLQKNALKYSKRPCLGELYLIDYAKQRARAGLALFPDGPSYTIPNNNNRDGKPFWYRLERTSGTYERMLHAFLKEWAILRPDQALALSPDVIDFMSELVQDTSDLPLQVQQYIARHYGYEPVSDLPQKTTHTVHTFNEVVSFDTLHKEGLIYHAKGDLIWRGVLNDVHLENEQSLRPADVRTIAKAIIQQAPLGALQQIRLCLNRKSAQGRKRFPSKLLADRIDHLSTPPPPSRFQKTASAKKSGPCPEHSLKKRPRSSPPP